MNLTNLATILIGVIAVTDSLRIRTLEILENGQVIESHKIIGMPESNGGLITFQSANGVWHVKAVTSEVLITRKTWRER
jgi:hypothetical protein